MSEFFSLEARGWKGLAGTAARCDGEIAGIVGGAVIALAGEGKARVVRLCMGGQAVAALVILRSGTSAWCWKIAYDEDYARFSPGCRSSSMRRECCLEMPASSARILAPPPIIP
jgi:hypothetical protein